MAKRKILIAGASGLVGYAGVRHFARLDGWEVVAVSRRTPPSVEGAEFISVDLLDPRKCEELFSQMGDVTHLAYAAVNEKPNLLEGWLERKQMEVNLAMLRNLFDPLHKVAKNLKHVTVLQGTKAYGAHIAPMPVPARERAPRHPHENFYWLQEDYIREKQSGRDWSWTILRPQLVVGEAVGSNLNVIPAIGVYGAILKEAGLPLAFPGGPPYLFELVDVDLLARAMEWAATTPACRNQHFNITNGDVFRWPEVWPTVADSLGMKVGPDKPMSLVKEMPKRAAEWAAIVRKYDLAAPADMHEFVGESFGLADFAFAHGAREVNPILVSTIKARQAGFHDCIDSEDLLVKCFRRFQELRYLPPPTD
jgi:nucleoside-diphosphate-sugar epimerase